MASRTESNAKNTTTKTTTDKSAADDFSAAYIRLRTILDSAEFVSMRYFLKDDNPAKRIKRAKEIERLLMPVIKELTGKLKKADEMECPEGAHFCMGCCVWYPCP